jgi:hypothetical protein
VPVWYCWATFLVGSLYQFLHNIEPFTDLTRQWELGAVGAKCKQYALEKQWHIHRKIFIFNYREIFCWLCSGTVFSLCVKLGFSPTFPGCSVVTVVRL